MKTKNDDDCRCGRPVKITERKKLLPKKKIKKTPK